MQPTCPRCGRPLAGAGMSAPGATPMPSCACGDAALHASPSGGGGKRSREVDPLSAPSTGSVEIDPWSVPPPADGYENLVLDDGNRPADEPAAAADPSPAGAPAPEPPTDPGVVPGRIAAARPRSRAILAGAGIAAALVAAVAAWLALRGPADGARPVRVRITEEVASFAAPPLAPIDPTFVERRRPAETRAEPPAAPPAASPPPRAAPSRGRASAPPPTFAPPPAPVPVREVREEPAAAQEPTAAAAPEPAPAKAPAAIDASGAVQIPLPPPPTPSPAATPREAASGRGRAPALQTRSCVEDALRVPRGLEGRLPAEVVLTVTVGADGRPGDVSVAGAVDSRLASALAVAVRTCRFTPGADASGQPAAAPATMRLRFEP